jgi:hypothetical protein
MEDVLRAVESGDGIDHQSPWKSVRDQLGPQLNFVALLDIPRLAAIVGGSVPQISPANAAQEQVFKAALRKIESVIKPSYAGVAVATEPQGATLVAVLPREQFLGAVSAMEILNGELENLVIAGSKSPDKTASATNLPITAHVEADGPADEDDAKHSFVVEAKLISGPEESLKPILSGVWFFPEVAGAGKPGTEKDWIIQTSASIETVPLSPDAAPGLCLRQGSLGKKETHDLVTAAQASAQLNVITAPPVTVVVPLVNCPGRRVHGDEAKIYFGDQKAERESADAKPRDNAQPSKIKVENGITLVVRPILLEGDDVSLLVQLRHSDAGQTRGVQFAGVTDDQIIRQATIRNATEICSVSPGHSALLSGSIPKGDKHAAEAFVIVLSAHRYAQPK